MKIRKKDFIIKSRRTGNRLAGYENQLVYEIFTADGTRRLNKQFYKWRDADRWLIQAVKAANKILEQAERG